jgi:hypothetical protein
MTTDFYYVPVSAPCRTVLLAAKALDVDMNLKLMNLMAGDHLKTEFLKVKYFSYYVHSFMWDLKVLGAIKQTFLHLGQMQNFILLDPWEDI